MFYLKIKTSNCPSCVNLNVYCALYNSIQILSRGTDKESIVLVSLSVPRESSVPYFSDITMQYSFYYTNCAMGDESIQ